MITPSYGITATERVLPRLALDFTTASLDPRVDIARSGNTATVINSSGVIEGINADLPRFDFDPVTLTCRGLLIEETRTNELLNSLIDGTDLVTQSVTVTAAARTLSFYGDGEIVLSGAASATVTGAGAYPTRTTYTFTPSAGSLTLTVTGTVQFAQLETGSFATSFIPTAGSAVTRNDDAVTMTGTNFSDWFNPTEGSFAVHVGNFAVGAIRFAYGISDGTASNELRLGTVSTGASPRLVVIVGGANQATIGVSANAGEAYRAASAYKADSFSSAVNGALGTPDTSGSVPSVDQLRIGARSNGTSILNGHVEKLLYYPQRLLDAELQSFSK
jgi:hypothetical protein